MITEKQQARHDIDVCKASLRAVIKQVSSIKGAYSTPMDNRVNCYLLSALNELTKIYDEDWTQYINTETFINAVETMEKLKEK